VIFKRLKKIFWHSQEVLEVIRWLGKNKKWWVIPLILVLFLFLILFVAVEGTVIAPFVYTLF
jgi:flagellar biosynthesis/type III secretory pathway M-ring protein FliF/YscJ